MRHQHVSLRQKFHDCEQVELKRRLIHSQSPAAPRPLPAWFGPTLEAERTVTVGEPLHVNLLSFEWVLTTEHVTSSLRARSEQLIHEPAAGTRPNGWRC